MSTPKLLHAGVLQRAREGGGGGVRSRGGGGGAFEVNGGKSKRRLYEVWGSNRWGS